MDTLTRNFALNLRAQRVAKKTSQETLAGRCGLSTSYISMLEREQRSPPLPTIETVAKALGVTAIELLQEPRSARRAR
jgi:transcriptional regulator with XRE-family HTH domain